MAALTKAAFLSKWNSLFADNATRDISEEDLRGFRQDISDSFLGLSDNFIDEDSFASDSATKVPSQQSVKAYVLSQTGGAGMQSVTRTISTAEILTGNSSPVEVLAAQGAGKIIQIVSPIVWKWNYAGAAFATNTTSKMYINSTAAITADNTVISLANIRYELLSILPTVDHTQATFENTPITWMVSTGDPTGGGTSTLTIHFKYFVLTI